MTLFYYSTQLLAQRMIDFGLQTQQGYLRMRHVTAIDTVADGNHTYMNVYAGGKSWRFNPEPSDMLNVWVKELKAAMEIYLHERVQLEQKEYGNSTLTIADQANGGDSHDLCSVNSATEVDKTNSVDTSESVDICSDFSGDQEQVRSNKQSEETETSIEPVVSTNTCIFGATLANTNTTEGNGEAVDGGQYLGNDADPRGK